MFVNIINITNKLMASNTDTMKAFKRLLPKKFGGDEPSLKDL